MLSFQVADIALGGFLCSISAAGAIGNFVALFYFLQRRADSSNSRYCKQIYSIIALVDLSICLTLFPIIEAAFREDRNGVFFGNSMFCDVWGMLWTGLPIMSIFLIAMLSVSRLLVIIIPTIRLKFAVSWCVPAGAALALTVLNLTLFHTKSMFVVYHPEWLACYPTVFPAQTEPTKLVGPEDIKRGLIQAALFFFLPGILIIPISISGILSVVCLRRSANISARMNSSTRRQNAATVTILLVTMLYFLFNLPLSLTVLGALVMNHVMSRNSSSLQVTVHEYNSAKFWDIPVLNYYGCFVVFYLCISLNSLCNPIMYLYRMDGFKKWIRNKNWLRKANKVLISGRIS